MKKRTLLLTALGTLALAGVAYAAVINSYTLSAKVTPTASGTKKKPKAVSVGVSFTVGTNPPGSRPFPVVSEKTSYAGLVENTTFFTGCSTSTLSTKGPGGCPRGSQVGSGFVIFLIGQTGNNTLNYSVRCRAEVTVFNGGHHNFILYVFKGSQRAGQPAPCPVPGGHVVINAGLSVNGGALNENVPIPQGLLHPTSKTEASITSATTNIPQKTTKHKGKSVGLLESVSCAPNHQRQIALTFKDSTGNSRRATDLVRCTGGQNQTRRHHRRG